MFSVINLSFLQSKLPCGLFQEAILFREQFFKPLKKDKHIRYNKNAR